MNGPHGMHNVVDMQWVDHKHNDFYEYHENDCKACHGTGLLGSPLGRAAAKRVFVIDTDKGPQTIIIAKGEEIRCNLCHKMPEYKIVLDRGSDRRTMECRSLKRSSCDGRPHTATIVLGAARCLIPHP